MALDYTLMGERLRKARAIPSKIKLTIPIEPLVRKQAMVTVESVNVPKGEELLLFPSKVPVEYYVAMSRLNDDEDSNIHLIVDFDEISSSHDGKLAVKVSKFPDRLKNLTLRTDSIEYAVIKD